MNKKLDTNTTAFAIDPSIRSCGWSLLMNGTILGGLARSKEKETHKAIVQIYYFLKTICPPKIKHLIVEKPIIMDSWTQEKKENIAKLLAAYGMCLTLASENTSMWTPSVPEWKGQTGKNISWIRTERFLNERKIKFEIMKNVPMSLEHNTKDAIALLVKYLQKEGIVE